MHSPMYSQLQGHHGLFNMVHTAGFRSCALILLDFVVVPSLQIVDLDQKQ
jgi:hypothetical protein